MSTEFVKLALIQFHAKVLAINENCSKAMRYMEEAAEQNADIVAFPELFYCGYHEDALTQHRDQLSQTLDGPIVQMFCAKAKELAINAVIPIILKEKEKLYNSAVLIDRKGHVVGVHHKVQLWAQEQQWFEAGNQFKTFILDGVTIGLLICYDSGFPEAARMLALQGAELIIVPTAFETPDKYRWDIYYQARALENGVYVAALNHAGEENGLHYFGNNRVVDPDGQMISEGSIGKEEMQLVTIDRNHVKKAQEKVPYLKDLLTSGYGYYKETR
ncbi:MAG: carbon-nitrogen hydrolase family protein [Sporolactobacillus sp.]